MTTIPDPTTLAIALAEALDFVRLPTDGKIHIRLHPYTWRDLAMVKYARRTPISDAIALDSYVSTEVGHYCSTGSSGEPLFMSQLVVFDPEVEQNTWQLVLTGGFKLLAVPPQ